MAITLADFTKIWASTSPLTPYSFSESNYKEGWNFVGATPPARQMWDSIQNQNDEKLKYIVDNFLPLDGGTMTGAISFDETGQIGYRATTHTEPANPCKQLILSATDIDHWSDEGGAKMSLHTYDTTQTNVQEDGSFGLLATDGSNSAELKGKPNGDLTWYGEPVLTPVNGARQMSVFCSGQKGKFTVSAPNNTTYFACIVAFGSPTNRGFNRIFFANGYWEGDFRNKYYRIPFTGDNDDGEYTVTISSSSNSFTFTTTNVGNIKCTVTMLVEDNNSKTTLTFTPT